MTEKKTTQTYTVDEAYNRMLAALPPGTRIPMSRAGLVDGMTPAELHRVFRRKIASTGIMLSVDRLFFDK